MPRPRVVARVAAVAVLVAGIAATVPAAILDVIGQRRHEANIRRLAEREGCSIDDARRLYFLARRDGYGAAHRAVFGDERAGRPSPSVSPVLTLEPEPQPEPGPAPRGRKRSRRT
jgi:hypothetical protein